MTPQGKQLDFTGQVVNVGIDVGKRRWDVRLVISDTMGPRFSQGPDPETLVRYLHGRYPGARYACVYEAGYCGFWIHERLRALGIECIVVNPADVPGSDKERVHKNNTVDASKLARELGKESLHGIYVPPRWALEDRTLVRMRSSFVRKQTRCKNQIKALLAFYGFHVPAEEQERYWSRGYIRWIESLLMQEPTGQQALQALLAELTFLRSQILDLTRKIRQLSRQERYARNVHLVCRIPGISLITTMVLLTELVDIARFPRPDQLISFVGLIPGEHSTGDEQHNTGMTYRRDAYLRYIMIEAAWTAIRSDPALMLAFTELSKRMKKTEAIVRIARKLVNRVRFVLKSGELYVEGVMAGRAT